jgi:hypothetical protein
MRQLLPEQHDHVDPFATRGTIDRASVTDRGAPT